MARNIGPDTRLKILKMRADDPNISVAAMSLALRIREKTVDAFLQEEMKVIDGTRGEVMKRITSEDILRVLSLHSAGMTPDVITLKLGLTQDRVEGILSILRLRAAKE